MLAAAARLRSRRDFLRTRRVGVRAGNRYLVVQLTTERGDRERVRAGFVVGRSVGKAVTRHRVTRQLRHLLRPRLHWFPAGSDVVVRALPPAATAGSAVLGRELDRLLRRLSIVPERPMAGGPLARCPRPVRS